MKTDTRFWVQEYVVLRRQHEKLSMLKKGIRSINYYSYYYYYYGAAYSLPPS